jgi:hypothetical protein
MICTLETVRNTSSKSDGIGKHDDNQLWYLFEFK